MKANEGTIKRTNIQYANESTQYALMKKKNTAKSEMDGKC